MENFDTTAIIVAITTVITAIFSNWDKIFRKHKVINAKVSGYRPTGNFETELRHFFEVSGQRKYAEQHAKQIILNTKNDLLQKYPEDSNFYTKLINRYNKERITFDQNIKKLIPIYKDHYTLKEIQELNKFYSTETMQNMVSKNEALGIKVAHITSGIIQEDQKIFNSILQELLDEQEAHST